jgi:hypothetical protein
MLVADGELGLHAALLRGQTRPCQGHCTPSHRRNPVMALILSVIGSPVER